MRKLCKPHLVLDVSHAQKSHRPVTLVTSSSSTGTSQCLLNNQADDESAGIIMNNNNNVNANNNSNNNNSIGNLHNATSIATVSPSPFNRQISTSAFHKPQKYQHKFEASLITDYLYLGSFTDAMQRAALVEHGITHILNVAKEVDSEHSSSDDDTHTPPSTSFVFKKIAVNDNSDEDIGKYFQECLEFIQAARDQHGKVLVHCRQGVSRSPTIVIAHLVHDLGYTLEDAMAHVQNCRESVCPNIGFILTLEEYADRSCRQDAVRLQGVSGQSLMRGCGGAPRGSVPSPSTVLMSPVPSCPHGVSMDAMTFSNAVLQC